MVYFSEEGKVWPQVNLRETISYRVGTENTVRKKFLKSVSCKNILLTEIHLYCCWKRNDKTFIDTMQIILFQSKVTLKIELLGKAVSCMRSSDLTHPHKNGLGPRTFLTKR